MAQTVEVPGQGSVEFPDDMSVEDMAAALKKSFPGPEPLPRAPAGFGQDPNAPAGMLTPPNPSAGQPTRATAFPGGGKLTELPTGPASQRAPLTHTNPPRWTPTPPVMQQIPGPNRFYDLYDKVGARAEALASVLTALPGLFTQGGRGLYGMVTGEDPMKTEAAQQRIGAATQWQPGGLHEPGIGSDKGSPGFRTPGAREAGETAGKVLGFPSIPAEWAGEQLAQSGHPWAATGARIGLDPWNYVGLIGLRGAKPAAPRVEPSLGLPPAPYAPTGRMVNGKPVLRPSSQPGAAPSPPGGRSEPAMGATPEPTPPEFKPIGAPELPAGKRTEPAVGQLPEPPKPEFPTVDTGPSPFRVVDANGKPYEPAGRTVKGKPVLRPPSEPKAEVSVPSGDTTTPVYTNAEGIPEVEVLPDEPAGPPQPPVPHETTPQPVSQVAPKTSPEESSTTFDMLGKYKREHPDYVPGGTLVVNDSEVRAGGREGGESRRVSQAIAFDTQLEQLLVDPARLQRAAAMERSKVTGDPKLADLYDKQAAQAFEKLQDRVRNMTPQEQASYGFLQGKPLTALQRASERYYDQVRGQMLRARESKPDAKGIQIRAKPYDEHYEGPPAEEPPVGGGPSGGPPSDPLSVLKQDGPLDVLGAEKPATRARDEQYERDMRLAEGQRDSGFIDETDFGKKSKGAGMRSAAREREATGNLTAKEQANKAAREASNYIGKEVTAEGRDGKVLRNAYGKVRVEFEDGTIQSFDPEQVQPRQAAGTQELRVSGLRDEKPAPAKKKSNGAIDHDNDSLITAIAKLGGLKPEFRGDLIGEAKGGGRVGIKHVFNKNGKTFDEMREALWEQGYIPADALADDGGIVWLQDAVRQEATGTRTYYSSKQNTDARYQRMLEEGDHGPGTLSANPIPSPVSAVRAARELGSMAGGAVVKTKIGQAVTSNPIARGIAAAQKGGRSFMNALQTMPEAAHEPVMMSFDFVRDVRAAAQRADTERRAPGADLNAIAQAEQARYQAAKEKLHEDLLDSGYAIMGGKDAGAEGFVPVHGRALAFGKGMYLSIRKDIAPALRQMLQSQDATAPGEALTRAVEDVWNTPQQFMMWDPAFHAGTVAGRMEPYIVKGNSLLKPEHYRFAKDTFTNPDAYEALVKDGLEPMKMSYSQKDFGAQVGPVEKTLGQAHDAWQAFHQLMPKAVNFAQLQFFDMMKKDLLAKGVPEDVAHATAIRQANNIAGNIPKEEMGRAWGHIMKFGVFSRSYTASVVRQMTQSIMSDKLLMAQLERKGYSAAEVKKFLAQNQDQFTKGLMLDYVNNYAVAQAMNYAATAAADAPDRKGKKGGHFTWDNPGAGRDEAFMPQRIYLNSRNGKDLYIETPMRTVRDMYLFVEQFAQGASGTQPDWLRRKSNPTSRAIAESVAGKTVYGEPIGDTPGAVAHAVGATGPWNKLPHAAAEAYREGNVSYLTGYLASEFDMPESIFLKVLGGQPHTERQGQDDRRSAAKATEAQDFLWSRARRVHDTWESLSPAAREKTKAALAADGLKAGMDNKGIRSMLTYIEREAQSNSGIRKGRRFEEQNPR